MAENTKPIVKKTYTDPITGKFIKGNPGGGRPAGSVSITTEIKRKLQQAVIKGGKTYLELVIDKILEKAIDDGDTVTLKAIWSYVDGMPQQSTDITSGGKTIFLPSEIMKKNGITSSPEDNS